MKEAIDVEDRRRKGLPIDEYETNIDCYLPKGEVAVVLEKLKGAFEEMFGPGTVTVKAVPTDRAHDDDWKHSIHPEPVQDRQCQEQASKPLSTEELVEGLEKLQRDHIEKALFSGAGLSAAQPSEPAKSRKQPR